jgi:hypothetical protein
MAAICTLKQEAGAGITATNDSGMWLYTAPAAPGGLPEGTPAPVTLPPGSFLGQFSPRLSFHFGRQIYSTALIGINITPTINGALFSRTAAGTVSVVAQKGDVAVDAAEAPLGNAKYSEFIGESSNDTDDTFYRATLTGPSPDVRPTTNEGIWLRFSIKDNGHGLRGSEQKIFEAFHTTKPNGLGLGLTICQTIINAHGGKLWAEANKIHGATFHFQLPITPENL